MPMQVTSTIVSLVPSLSCQSCCVGFVSGSTCFSLGGGAELTGPSLSLAFYSSMKSKDKSEKGLSQHGSVKSKDQREKGTRTRFRRQHGFFLFTDTRGTLDKVFMI